MTLCDFAIEKIGSSYQFFRANAASYPTILPVEKVQALAGLHVLHGNTSTVVASVDRKSN